MRTMRTILQVFILGLLFGCSNPNESYFVDTLKKTDKIYLYKRIGHDFCPIKSYNYDETLSIIDKIKTEYRIEIQRKFLGDYKLDLFESDSLIGTLKIVYGDTPFVNFNSTDRRFGFRLNYSLGRFIEETGASEYADCSKMIDTSNTKYYDKNKWIRFDSISVMEFVELLPVKIVAPNYFYIINTVGQADSAWITKEDIPKLIKLIDSEQPAYCVMRVISSHLPVGEESTIGGQVMNLIDSYRLNKPYPFFSTDCSKTDKDRQKEILDWWNEINK